MTRTGGRPTARTKQRERSITAATPHPLGLSERARGALSETETTGHAPFEEIEFMAADIVDESNSAGISVLRTVLRPNAGAKSPE
jgi:hypothetical protein